MIKRTLLENVLLRNLFGGRRAKKIFSLKPRPKFYRIFNLLLISYFLRNKRLVGLHDSLEPDVRSAEASGLSLTGWRVGKKLARNQEIRQEVAIEWTRVLTRNITSPVQQARRRLLDTHLDEVSKTNLTSVRW